MLQKYKCTYLSTDVKYPLVVHPKDVVITQKENKFDI